MVLPCQDPSSGIRIDLIFSFSPYEKKALERTNNIPIGKALVAFASIEDLLIHKLIAGRPRDLEDVRGILIKNPALDQTYLLHWLQQFEEALAKPFSKIFKDLR